MCRHRSCNQRSLVSEEGGIRYLGFTPRKDSAQTVLGIRQAKAQGRPAPLKAWNGGSERGRDWLRGTQQV